MSSSNETYVFDSAQRVSRALDEFREIFRYRSLLYQLIRRDILTRYKRSVLGVAWTMLNPLGMMLVLTIAFSQIFRFNTPNYPAYVLSGLLVWNFFSQTTTAAMVSLVWGGGLFKRIYMPRAIFAFSSMGTGVVNLGLSLVPMLLIMLVTRTPIRWSILFLPVPILLLVFFSLGVGLLISTMAVYFPDVAEMYQIVLTAWMYLTPIIYPSSLLPENLRFWLQLLNPMYRIVELFRLPIYDGRLPVWGEIWPSILVTLFVTVVGWIVFTRKSDEFAYRV
jgi:ABC-type polysaccharide/polyol phosphate export permease